MGFNTHSWNNPITLDANNLNRIEQGIKNSHDTIEIISEEVSNLQNRHADIVKDLNALTKDAPNIIEALNNISSLLKNNDISAVLSSADSFLMKTKQTLTASELDQIYKNLHMDKFLKLTSVKVDGNNVVNGSEINIVLPKIDDTLDINSLNAISNKAVTKALSNINIEVDVPTHLSQLQQDKDHLTVSIAEKTKWDSYKDILDNIRIEETDPTVPAWAKEPVKPLYHYNEIIDVPDLTVYINKVTSVNNKTGDIVLNAADVGALPNTTELFSGSYNDLINKPNLFSGNYNDLSNKPTLFSGNYNDLTNKPTIPTTASQVGALPDTTKYGATLSLTMNTSTYVVTAQLKDQAGNNLGTAQTIDLPLESVVVSGSYDDINKKVILTLKDGSTIDFSVEDLIDGLASQSDLNTTNTNVTSNTNAIGNIETSLGTLSNSLTTLQTAIANKFIIRRWA